MQKINAYTLKFSIALLIIASPLLFIQAVCFEKIYLTTGIIKMAIGGIVLLVVIANLFLKNKQVRIGFEMLMFSFFLLFNLVTILYNSISQVGIINSFNAFAYNYSLLMFVFPFFFIATFNSRTKWDKIPKLLYVFIFIIDIYGIVQYVSNKYILLSPEIISLLESGDYIKFDHISGHIRVSSLLKSPLEFGIMNVVVSGMILTHFLEKGKKYILLSLLFVLTSISVYITLSRTAIVMFISNIIIVLWLFVYYRVKTFFNDDYMVKLYWICSVLFLSGIFILTFLVTQLFSDYIVFNPTNLLIRFGIWQDLLDSFIFFENAFFGFGIIQNGSFGDYHSVIIDNTFIGIVMTGGIVGLILFSIIIEQALHHTYQVWKTLDERYKVFSFAFISFLPAFLIGGLTENLMHIMAYPFFGLTLLNTMPRGEVMNQHEVIYNEASSVQRLWKVIKNRKKLIMIFYSIVLLFVLSYYHFAAPIYESRAEIIVGFVTVNEGKNGFLQIPLEDPSVIEHRLKNRSQGKDTTLSSEASKVYSVSLEKKDTVGNNNAASNIVVITSRGPSAVQAHDYLEEVIGELIKEHEKRWHSEKIIREKKLEVLQQQYNLVRAQIDSYTSKSNSNGDFSSALYLIERNRLAEQVIEFENRITELQLSLSEMRQQPTKIIINPSLPTKPISPKPLLLILAITGGFIIALLFALSVELIQKSCHKQRP